MGRLLFLLVIVAAIFAVIYFPEKFDADSLRGKRVLVTGASSGIGEQVAYHYCKFAASVVIVARRANLLQKVATNCKQLGAERVEYVVADLAKKVDRKKIVDETERHLGGLDHLILNHAILASYMWMGTPKNMTNLEELLQVNYVSYVEIASLTLPMLTASKGHIGIVSSGSGKIPVAYMPAYASTKFALQGFFTAYREELRLRQTGVSVTLCILGLVDTDKANSVMSSFKFSDFWQPTPLPVNETALAIIKGVTRRDCEMYYPRFCIVGTTHTFFPSYVEGFLSSLLHDAAV